jgi:hypothetical protein
MYKVRETEESWANRRPPNRSASPTQVPRARRSHILEKKKLCMVTLCSKYHKSLTFENLYRSKSI